MGQRQEKTRAGACFSKNKSLHDSRAIDGLVRNSLDMRQQPEFRIEPLRRPARLSEYIRGQYSGGFNYRPLDRATCQSGNTMNRHEVQSAHPVDTQARRLAVAMLLIFAV